jgi:hypothetical protein
MVGLDPPHNANELAFENQIFGKMKMVFAFANSSVLERGLGFVSQMLLRKRKSKSLSLGRKLLVAWV